MRFAQANQVFNGQQIARDFAVGLDYGAAQGAVNHRHLAKGHAGGEGGEAFSRSRGKNDYDADIAARDEEEMAGFFADANDRFA